MEAIKISETSFSLWSSIDVPIDHINSIDMELSVAIYHIWVNSWDISIDKSLFIIYSLTINNILPPSRLVLKTLPLQWKSTTKPTTPRNSLQKSSAREPPIVKVAAYLCSLFSATDLLDTSPTGKLNHCSLSLNIRPLPQSPRCTANSRNKNARAQGEN